MEALYSQFNKELEMTYYASLDERIRRGLEEYDARGRNRNNRRGAARNRNNNNNTGDCVDDGFEEDTDMNNNNNDDDDDGIDESNAENCDDDGYGDEEYDIDERDYLESDCLRVRWIVDCEKKRFEKNCRMITNRMFEIWLAAPNREWAVRQTLMLMKFVGDEIMSKITEARKRFRELQTE